MKSLGASEFKARCLALLDEVARTGEPIRISKRGKPVACLVPAAEVGGAKARYPQDTIQGTVHIVGNLDPSESAVPIEWWEVLRDAPRRAGKRR